jgi:predicted DNA-binding transcriptional regulator AlpA
MRQTPTLPDTGFLRLPDVLRLYPVSKSTWWKGIQDGKFPAAVRIGDRAVAWRAEDIRSLIENAAIKPAPPASVNHQSRATNPSLQRLRKRIAKTSKQGAT